MTLPEVLNNSSLLILVGNSEGVLFLTQVTQQDLDFYDWFLVIGFSTEQLNEDLYYISTHRNVVKDYFGGSEGYYLNFDKESLLSANSWSFTDGFQLEATLDDIVRTMREEKGSVIYFAPEDADRVTLARFGYNHYAKSDTSQIQLYFPIGTSIPKKLLQRNVYVLAKIMLCLASPNALSINYWGNNCSQVTTLLGSGLHKLPVFIAEYFDIRWPLNYAPTLVTYPSKWISKPPSTGIEYLNFLKYVPTKGFSSYISGLVYTLEKTRNFSLLNLVSKDEEELRVEALNTKFLAPLLTRDKMYTIPSQDLYIMALLVSLGKKDLELDFYTSYSTLDLLKSGSNSTQEPIYDQIEELHLSGISSFFKYSVEIVSQFLKISEQSSKIYKECKHLDNFIKRWALSLYRRIINLELPAASVFPKRSQFNKTVFEILKQSKKLSFDEVFNRLRTLVNTLYLKYLLEHKESRYLSSSMFNKHVLPVSYNALRASGVLLDTWNSYYPKLNTVVIRSTKVEVLEYISIRQSENVYKGFKSALEGLYGTSSFIGIINAYGCVLKKFKPGDIRILTSDGFEIDLHKETLRSLEEFLGTILKEDVYPHFDLKSLNSKTSFTDSNKDGLDPTELGEAYFNLIDYRKCSLGKIVLFYRGKAKEGDTLMLRLVYVPLLKALIPDLITMLQGSISSSQYPMSVYKSYILVSLEHLLKEIQDLDLDNM